MKKHSTKIRVDVRQHIHNIAKMYFEGKTSYEIAAAFKCSRCVITTTLKKNGYKLRSGGQRKGIYPAWNKGKEYPQIVGDKNPRWKGGITPLNQRIRHCLQYKKWIKDVLLRDNFTCVICGQRGGDLEVDHSPITFCQIIEDYEIKSLEEANKCKLFWDIANGRTVCMKCHKRGNIKPVRSRFRKVHSNKK